MKKTVLVTGGAGFIGSHLAEALLQKGYHVRVLDSLIYGKRQNVPPEAEFIHGDITDLTICMKAAENAQGIFHLAAMPRVGPSFDTVEICTQANIVGTQNMLIAAREHRVRKFIYSGSSTYYGNQPVPHREYETPAQLLNFYGLTKQIGEQYCQMFNRVFNVPAIVLRYFNAYGPRQPQAGVYALVLGIFLRAWMKGEPLIIHGDGAQRRDFVHVKDIARANIMAFESDRQTGIYNVGSGTNVSVKELADMISSKQTHAPSRAGDAKETLADIRLIEKELGWKPQVSFIEGLNDLKQRLQTGKETLEEIAS